jgi:hypothetical protein
VSGKEFIAAECDYCGDIIECKADENPCPKCSGYFHKGDCYLNHVEKEHRS